MATQLPPVPPPLDPSLPRYKPDGRPTQVQVTQDTKMKRFLDAVKSWIEAQP